MARLPTWTDSKPFNSTLPYERIHGRENPLGATARRNDSIIEKCAASTASDVGVWYGGVCLGGWELRGVAARSCGSLRGLIMG